MDEPTCSTDGCQKRARQPSGLCRGCYLKEWRRRQGSCMEEGCEDPVSARKRCSAHYLRLMAGELDRPVVKKMKRDGLCSEGCGRPIQARGRCLVHYGRWRKTGDAGPIGNLKAPRGAGSTDKKSGYRYLTVNGRRIAEHRYVMEQMLGRRLERWETPHHKNGRRADNSPGNLELWVMPQPAGQRLADLVAFVVEHYPDEVRKALTA